VSGAGDSGSGMSPTALLNDETIEAIVVGDEVDARFDQLVAFTRYVRALGDGPAPPASAALEAVFAGDRPRRRFPSGRRWFATAAARVAGLGVVAKIGLGSSLAAAGVVAAGAGGVLPGPATQRVRDAIEAVTPVDFGGPGVAGEPADRDDTDRFRDRVSTDATGESDGEPGDNGHVISDGAPGAAHRPDDADDRGADSPRETPASDLPAGASPGATAPGTTAPGRTVHDSAATPSSTVPSPPAPTASTVPTLGNAGGGASPATRGG
jgi:hypothetical protein